MDFKYINDKNKTPNAKCSSGLSCDSPFKLLPSNFSTPPSRFAKIVNPFDSHHLIERLHLPTFSPSVFATASTPKTEEKFKWSIDDISNLKPADIDEATISQHVFNEDPHTESIVQEKLEMFFSETAIVPSPMTEIVRVPLVNIADSPKESVVRTSKEYSNNSAQTILTLPPKLPEALEKLLKPFFTYTEDQQGTSSKKIEDTSLYQNLFEAKTPTSGRFTHESSPALSTGLSPMEFPHLEKHVLNRESINADLSVLNECNLSPILMRKSPKETSRSTVCRLDFSSAGMSVDTSFRVPSLEGQLASQSDFLDNSSPSPAELLSDSIVNWDMEYQHVSLASPSPDVDQMDISHSNTPHSRIFTSQRKRLSDSFKNEEDDNKENKSPSPSLKQNRKLFKNDVTDMGYHTGSDILFNDTTLPSTHMYVSTPSKHNHF